MKTRPLPRKIEAMDLWGRRPVYRARIINTETAGIVVKSPRALSVGKRISFATLTDLQAGDSARNASCFKWRSGVIWRIEKDCLHLTRT